MALLCAATLVIGLVAAPNNYDSLAYHLARVMHWQQNGSVSFYPTTITRQLYQPPFAEYVLAHLILLTGSDRFVHLVQWGAMVGTLAALWRIARHFGGGRREQVATVVFAATIPMGLHQSMSTQNDYVLAFWLALVVLMIFEKRALYVGAALGLALLTKGTAYLFIPPLVAWWLYRVRRIQPVLLAGAVVFALILPQTLRNWTATGNPLGTSADNYANGEFSPRVLVSNLYRNIGLNLPLPSAETLHAAFGLDVNDLRTTYANVDYADSQTNLFTNLLNEDTAGAPLHALALLMLFPFILTDRRHRVYTLALIVAFLVFCLYLRWQPWHTRLQLPLLLLSAPLVALAFRRLPLLRRLWMAVTLVTAGVVVLLNASHPLLGPGNIFETPRIEQYFRGDTSAYERYRVFARRYADCDRIHVQFGDDGREYPLWLLLPNADFEYGISDACARFVEDVPRWQRTAHGPR